VSKEEQVVAKEHRIKQLQNELESCQKLKSELKSQVAHLSLCNSQMVASISQVLVIKFHEAVAGGHGEPAALGGLHAEHDPGRVRAHAAARPQLAAEEHRPAAAARPAA